MWRKLLTLLLFMQLMQVASGQNMYRSIASDTIITVRSFPTNIYLLDGKKLNLPVMDFFMSDCAAAHDQLRFAMLSNQLAAAGYSIGTLFGLTGLLVNRQSPQLGGNLLQIGGVGIGTGFLFQVFSNKFKKKAVRLYNEDVRALHKVKNKAGFGVKGTPNGICVTWTLK